MKWLLASSIAALSSLTIVCCVGDDPAAPPAPPTDDAGNPSRDEFDIEKVEVGPLIQGGTVQVTVALKRADGFQGPVNVSAAGLPPNVTASPLVIGAAASEGGFAITAAATAAQGTTEITITASDLEGKRKHEKKVPLLVRGPSGSLDTTFGQGGKAILTTQINSLQGLAIQPDGKSVLALSSEDDLVAYRLDANGAPDTTFGNTARAVADLRAEDGGATTDTTTGIGLSPDGTIFVSGYTTQPSSKYALARFTAVGKPDALFDNDGYLFSAYGPKPELLGNVLANGVAAQPDGKPILAATIMSGPPDQTNALVLVRFKQNGAVDPEFANGFPTAHSPDVLANEACDAVAVADDGKVLCAGSSSLGPGLGSRMIVWRVDSKGASDGSFHAGDGIVIIPTGTLPGGRAHDVHALPNGRVLVTGSATTDGVSYQAVAVLLSAAGALDPAFSGKGFLLFDWGALLNSNISPHSSVDAKGRIVVVAATGTNAIGIARIDPNGQLDETFAPSGKQIRTIDEAPNGNVFVAHQADGRIVVASSMGATAKKVVVLRLWP